MTGKEYKALVNEIVAEFDAIPLRKIHKPRVGVVGEILVKFHPVANNDIFSVIEREGAECVVPDLMDFMPDTKDIDVVYEIMLRQRDVPLSEHIEKLENIEVNNYEST